MSYDVSLRIEVTKKDCWCQTCGNEHMDSGLKEVFSANYTSNTARMWNEAGVTLRDFDQKRANELSGPLADAISVIESDTIRFKIYEPGNGWGTVEGTLRFLRSILRACREFPNAILKVRR